MTHTKEPWYISGTSSVMVISENATIAKCCGIRIGTKESVQAEIEANARRIAACVNACAGTTTSDLVQIAENGGWQNLSVEWKMEAETHADNADSFADRITELEQQRDELLSAARYVAADLHSRGVVYPALDEAIAKAGIE